MAAPGEDRYRVDLSALDRVGARLAKFAAPDMRPLMISLMKIIADDNRRGVLAGTDKDGKPMAPVTYRPIGPRPHNRPTFRRKVGRFAGFGPHKAGWHNNLTYEEYRRLSGPPLAPRGAGSRVITNLKTGWEEPRPGEWLVIALWEEVVSLKGVPFLHAHFTGASVGRGRRVKLPTRDLRGLRPDGFRIARNAARNFLRHLIRISA